MTERSRVVRHDAIRKIRRGLAFAALIVLAQLASAAVSAHALAPALLELVEGETGVVDVVWKRSSQGVAGNQLEPVVPEDCPIVSEPRFEQEGVAVLLRWRIDCGDQGLVGRPVRVDSMGPTTIDTLVRIELSDGRRIQRVLRRDTNSMIVPARASRLAVFRDYLAVGFDHILSGGDHLLFVFGLFMLCANFGPLAKTITAFTVGHSITLSVAALGYSNLPSGPIEVLIAASVLALAVDLARVRPEPSWMRRYPWPMALGFGLLHGMGFAGALREVGLPSGEIPMALFSFNVGIELGQLVFVASLAALARLVGYLAAHVAPQLAARVPRLATALPQRIMIYTMGSLAAFWVIERSFRLL